MSTRTSWIVTIIVIIASAVFSFVAYPQMPEMSASHWNAAGEVDDYMPRFWAAFLMPIVSVGLLLMFMIIPVIDPLRKNIAKFREYFNAFIVLIVAFLLYIHAITLMWNLGYEQINMDTAILPAVGMIFVFAGVMMRKAKRNFFIGIRTPWTLSSDVVWEKTHALGGIIFMIAGGIVFLLGFLGETGIWIMLGTIIVLVLIPVVYSYILFERLERNK